MTRVRLQANTCKAISEATRGSVFIRKCVAPIRALIVPKGCSTVSRRTVRKNKEEAALWRPLRSHAGQNVVPFSPVHP
jgi:hypothetical protein